MQLVHCTFYWLFDNYIYIFFCYIKIFGDYLFPIPVIGQFTVQLAHCTLCVLYSILFSVLFSLFSRLVAATIATLSQEHCGILIDVYADTPIYICDSKTVSHMHDLNLIYIFSQIVCI